MAKQLEVLQDHCIHCGMCVMMEYANNENGEMHIKKELPQEKRPEAMQVCPVGAIQEIDQQESTESA